MRGFHRPFSFHTHPILPLHPRYNSEDELSTVGTDWIALDVDRVDMRVHFALAAFLRTAVNGTDGTGHRQPWYQFTQRAGDCLYIPYAMAHFVDSDTTPTAREVERGDPQSEYSKEIQAGRLPMHVAVSYMWLPQVKYDDDMCQSIVGSRGGSRSGSGSGSGSGSRSGSGGGGGGGVDSSTAGSMSMSAPYHNERFVVPIGATDLLWYYSGMGVVPQGYPDPWYEMAEPMLQVLKQMQKPGLFDARAAVSSITERAAVSSFAERGDWYLTQNVFTQWAEIQLGNEDSGDDREMADARTKFIESAWKRLIHYAADPAKGIHSSEMIWPTPAHYGDQGGRIPLSVWLTMAVEFDAEGGLATNEYHVYEPRPMADVRRAERVVSALERGNFDDAAQSSLIVSQEYGPLTRLL
jgi:hypothetical protein